ncbi:MAG: hypothetical protein QXL57_08830 [Candidatus Bathyarchaeia archaeon]
MDDIDIAIIKFFDMFSFGTPKELIDVIYSDFEKQYPDRNSFRIIIHRHLKHLPLKKLPLPGFYCHPKREHEFYQYLRFKPNHLFNRAIIIIPDKQIITSQSKIIEHHSLREWYNMFEPLNKDDMIKEFLNENI